LEGRGKLFLLSIASTVRWKRRKRASARTRVEGRSIVDESSLTIVTKVRAAQEGRGSYERHHTIFQDFIKVLEVVHNDISVLLEDGQRHEKMEAAAQPVRP
jgi:hypothetical protein